MRTNLLYKFSESAMYTPSPSSSSISGTFHLSPTHSGEDHPTSMCVIKMFLVASGLVPFFLNCTIGDLSQIKFDIFSESTIFKDHRAAGIKVSVPLPI